MACEEILVVEDISQETVTVLAPASNSVVAEGTVTFSWNELEDAEQYRIQLATPSFENASQILLDSTIASTSFSKTLMLGDYEWRVRAENSEYQTPYTILSFSVFEGDAVDITSSEVVLLAPNENLVFATTDTINFSWEAVLNAEDYTLQIATPSFTSAIEIIENEIIATTSFSVSNLDAQNYEWRVKGQNSEFETNYATQSFTVE